MPTPVPISRLARICLHLACLLHGRHFRWHLGGLLREFLPARRKAVSGSNADLPPAA